MSQMNPALPILFLYRLLLIISCAPTCLFPSGLATKTLYKFLFPWFEKWILFSPSSCRINLISASCVHYICCMCITWVWQLLPYIIITAVLLHECDSCCLRLLQHMLFYMNVIAVALHYYNSCCFTWMWQLLRYIITTYAVLHECDSCCFVLL
jgi:hypothetical protein